MASALSWSERDWAEIPEDSVDGVATRDTFVVCAEAASKISSLRLRISSLRHGPMGRGQTDERDGPKRTKGPRGDI